MECPLCFDKYTDANPAKGPGGACTHFACDNCWKEIGRVTRPPFTCAECRRDLTTWFVDEFGWVDPMPEPEAVDIDEENRLDEQLRIIRDNASAATHRIFVEAQARMTLNNARFQADIAALMARRT